MHYNFPFQIDKNGNTATVDNDIHIKQMIEQILFTSPGERVNRPDFGCGLNQLVFASNSDELVISTQFLVQGSLQKWLGDLITVESVMIKNDESKLVITVQYKIKNKSASTVAQFTTEV
ncbi:MAG: GPW/gp25 family protein [Nitrosopumilus sp.]|nr:GPW/gp25 family protein [Nitrosopumilus sp.]MDH3735409.1 GPW/gp25 family protein [Nitrosopumilus sp.]MDH3822229.1 GPW/gp25 family protein [Nitrosopumilus sp.]MDH3832557.1 GPW/gp25 family protein [Nitrosopumilus sp.]